tara:strand:+ start:1389 stop:1811 length:423 start_codon:yes stop_codon:yes gene_type:complete
MSIQEFENGKQELDFVYGRQEVNFEQINMINLDLFVKISVYQKKSLKEIKTYIHQKAKNSDVVDSNCYIVPVLYNYYNKENEPSKLMTFISRIRESFNKFLFKKKDNNSVKSDDERPNTNNRRQRSYSLDSYLLDESIYL